MTIFVLLIAGMLLLWLGAECILWGGVSLALRAGLPILIVGMTLMGYCTGIPEVVVSVQASMLDKGDISIGNVIGSNIANTGLILGLSTFCCPIKIQQQSLKIDIPLMIAASLLLCLLLAFTNDIGRPIGLLFLLGLVGYTYWSVKEGRKNFQLVAAEKEQIEHYRIDKLWIEILLIGFGFFALFCGGRTFLIGAIQLAKIYDISDAVIGVTIIALGTSLPEMAVSLIAVIKKYGDISLGNIVGSNIFNILAIVGLAATIHPLKIQDITWVDYSFMTFLACAMWLLSFSKKTFGRSEGAFFVLSYCCYIAY
ncbi:MAG: calcium/sodium antiporter, partial [Chlamydiia bacterium]|nr:calcium/sodium antiporter [Chlamydiia bacterium]